jgi:hypothetical protein
VAAAPPDDAIPPVPAERAAATPPPPGALEPDPAGAAEPSAAAETAGVSPPLPALPASTRQRFRVYWGDFTEGVSVARLEYRLEHDGQRYAIHTVAEAQGLISLVYSGTLSQTSRGRLGPEGLRPTHYAERRGRRPERTLEMEPDTGLLRPAAGEPVPMPAGTQDRLSVVYQIGLLARAEPERFAPGAVHALPVASLREVRIERFIVVGDEVLMAPGGPLRALRLFRPALPGTPDPRIDLWLGYDRNLLPVRLRIQDASERVLDQVLDRDG